jgi:hypothetical protein
LKKWKRKRLDTTRALDMLPKRRNSEKSKTASQENAWEEGTETMQAFISLHPGKTPNTWEIDARIPFSLTKEQGGFTAYTPYLDFSTCGRDQKDAEEMFKKGVMVFLKELVRMRTLDEYLRERGWSKSPLPKQPDRWVPPKPIWKEEKIRTAVAVPA